MSFNVFISFVCLLMSGSPSQKEYDARPDRPTVANGGGAPHGLRLMGVTTI